MVLFQIHNKDNSEGPNMKPNVLILLAIGPRCKMVYCTDLLDKAILLPHNCDFEIID